MGDWRLGIGDWRLEARPAMTRTARLILVVTLFSMALAGCGTVSDWKRGYGPRVYGGVQWDLGDQAGCVITPFWIAIWDVPFSLIADTILLPYTIFCTPREREDD